MADSEHPEPGLQETMFLVGHAQKGDSVALEELFRRYYPRILAVVRKKMGRGIRRFEESQDVIQNTLATALRKLDDFEMRDNGAFLRWLGTIADHQIRALHDHHHAQKRGGGEQHNLEADAGEAADARGSPDGERASPLSQALGIEAAELIQEAVALLPEELRAVVRLRTFGGHTFQRIGEELGCSEPTARQRYQRGLQAIEKRMSEL